MVLYFIPESFRHKSSTTLKMVLVTRHELPRFLPISYECRKYSRAPLPLNSWPLKAWYAIGLYYQMVDPFSVEYKTFIIVAELLIYHM